MFTSPVETAGKKCMMYCDAITPFYIIYTCRMLCTYTQYIEMYASEHHIIYDFMSKGKIVCMYV